MFFLPTYAQIGIAASCLVTICRMVQGMSSMGEIIGAVLYLTESIKEPKSYRPVAFIRMLPGLSTFAALGVGTIAIKYGFNWRIAFLIGSLIALVGSMARSALRETPEFVDAKKRMLIKETSMDSRKIDKKIAFSYLFLECTWPVWVFVIYIYCANALKNDFGYSAFEIIEHNLYVSLAGLASCFTVIYFTNKIHPIQIMKIIVWTFCIFFIPLIYLLAENYTVTNIFILQYFMILISPTTVPGDPIILKHFPVLKRFFATSMLYAVSRIIVYFFTSFGTLYFTESFGVYGLLVVITPAVICYLYGLNTFYQLEREAGNYPKKTSWSIVYLDNLYPQEK
jgi:MFS family permease